MAEGTVYNRQSSAIGQLAEILTRNEKKARLDFFCTLEARIPPPTYASLFGVDDVVEIITALLTQDGGPWIVALVGIGGIGKTALANYIMRTLINLSLIHI